MRPKERRDLLRARWANGEDFVEKIRERDLLQDDNAQEILLQLEILKDTFHTRYQNLVEIGCGDGKLLSLMRSMQPDLEMIGSDLPGPRLAAAQNDYPELNIIEGDAVAMAHAHARHNTIFVAMNVLGNLVEEDLLAFLTLIEQRGAALIFSARELALDTNIAVLDKKVAFAYNYRNLAADLGLTFFSSVHRYYEMGTQQGGIVGTLVREKQLKSFRPFRQNARFIATRQK